MAPGQLRLFQRETSKGIIPSIPMAIQTPTEEKTVLHTLTAYYTYLRDGGYSQYTPDNFTGDVKKFGVFLKEKPLKDITTKDIQSWITLWWTPLSRHRGDG